MTQKTERWALYAMNTRLDYEDGYFEYTIIDEHFICEKPWSIPQAGDVATEAEIAQVLVDWDLTYYADLEATWESSDTIYIDGIGAYGPPLFVLRRMADE